VLVSRSDQARNQWMKTQEPKGCWAKRPREVSDGVVDLMGEARAGKPNRKY
jgi:hypothetical protein